LLAVRFRIETTARTPGPASIVCRYSQEVVGRLRFETSHHRKPADPRLFSETSSSARTSKGFRKGESSDSIWFNLVQLILVGLIAVRQDRHDLIAAMHLCGSNLVARFCYSDSVGGELPVA